jgi:natural product biosynthesis luciferase-like monooxygenase protein
MLFHNLRGDRRGVDIEQMVAELNETIDVEAYRRAWGVVAARHAILRTRFAWVGLERPVQQVVRSVETPFSTIDLRGRLRGSTDDDEIVRSYLREDRERGFDLSVAPLWRVAFLRVGESRWKYIWTYSHTLLDNAFSRVLNDVELAVQAEASARPAALPEPRPYREYCVWLAEELEKSRAGAQAFFREMLRGAPAPSNLAPLTVRPADRMAPAPPKAHYETKSFRLSATTSAALRGLKKDGVAVSTVVEAAWALVLAAFDGADDVVFGATRDCRHSSIEGAEAIVGLCINTLPRRIKVDPSQPVLEWLRQVHAVNQASLPFQRTALVDVIAALDRVGASPLFETVVVYNDAHIDARMKSYGAPWTGRTLELHDQMSFPCGLMGYGDSELHFRVEYDPERFAAEGMDRVASLTRAILEAIPRHLDGKVGDLPRLPEDDERRLLVDRRGPDVSSADDPCIHRQVEAQAKATADRMAVVFRDESITYAELNERANRVARKLRDVGVGPGSLVGVFVQRSIEMVVGLLGILKAGGAYVPMDPAYPSSRIAGMLEDTQARVVVTLSGLRGSLPPTSAELVELDGLDPNGDERHGEADAPHDASGDDLAYVIFTSGSTGRPKGTEIRHRNVTNFFAGMDRAISEGRSAATGPRPGVWLAVTSISFDISVLEIFWTLARGFTVVVQEAPHEARPASRTGGAVRTAKKVGFSLFYFAADAGRSEGEAPYRLLLDGARFADAHDFTAVWTPERHFHSFGGLYPNPAVTSAAVATVTQRIGLRAGSVVLPLHNPIRCAEEWSMVDNLSNGRVGLSFASGWHAADFVLMPENFEHRRRVMSEGIETIRRLWRGEAITAKGGDGKNIDIRIFPRPVQREPPMWITASGSPETFAMAGRLGAYVLTNLLVMTAPELEKNIACYRDAYRAAGHAGEGHVTLMLHTFVGPDLAAVREIAREPFIDYLRTSTDLINKTRWELTAFAKPHGNGSAARGARDLDDLSAEDMKAILDHAFERYFVSAGLFGTPRSCGPAVENLRALGVDEIACLADFGIATDTVLQSLPYLNELRASFAAASSEPRTDDDYSIAAQIKRHGVTHLQCTPTLASVLTGEREGLDALASLDALLLGGEAMPMALANRLRPVVRGRILNMYGPTETTIWSTCAEVSKEHDARVTIGRPIANTDVYVVDARLRLAPIGVPGELLIGGAGVSRGYLARPELTREKFIPDALSAAPRSPLYRTGDLVRWSDDGALEFLGRIDHQVKLRGYRVELGEIESALTRHPAIRQAVVVARPDGSGDARLVAYVVAREGGDPNTNGPSGAVAHWRTLWDGTYEATPEAEGGPEVFAGWKSSYDSAAIDDEEMEAWLGETVSRVQALAPKRVLEIGCGGGLLLCRVAPQCERYVGADFSPVALERVAQKAARMGLKDIVSFHELAADRIDALGETRFDTIVLNSVAQYFPDVGYFLAVVEKAWRLLEAGGSLFIGDVRSLPLLRAFYASVELHVAPDTLAASELAARVERRAAYEGELLFDPQLFLALKSTMADLANVQIRLKDDANLNELTRFRYDVTLRKGPSTDKPVEPPTVDAPAACTRDALRMLLRGGPQALRIVGLVNARVADAVRTAELLSRAEGGTTGELRSTVSARREENEVDPSSLLDLDPAYDAFTTWSAAGPERFDLIVRHRASGPASVVVAPFAPNEQRPWSAYANKPSHGAAPGALTADLRAHLRAILPEHMVPTAFVRLKELPVTPNGKVDRNALPAPDATPKETARSYSPPETDIERMIATICRDLLSLDKVSVDDNFFDDLGANSLMMVQANGRLVAELGRPVPLVDMFTFPTVRALAAHIAGTGQGRIDALKQSQDRALARKEALAMRRGARQGLRVKDEA